MILNENFRKSLSESLTANKSVLEKSSIDLVKESLSGSFRLILDQVSTQYDPLVLDIESSLKTIGLTMERTENPTLQSRKMNWDQFRYNEVKFDIYRSKPLPEWLSPTFHAHRIARERLEYQCEEGYWLQPEKMSVYQEIADFDCFVDTTILEAELRKYRNLGDVVNVDGWAEFIFELQTRFFPAFNFSEKWSKRGMHRFLQPLNDQLLFGFEYRNTHLKKELHREGVRLPYFNLILINSSATTKEIPKDYITKYDANILSLGMLANPFFSPPCFPVDRFDNIDRYHDPNNPANEELLIMREFRKVNSQEYRIIHDHELGERLKKHAFFYMDALSYSSMSYVDYLKKSILDAASLAE